MKYTTQRKRRTRPMHKRDTKLRTACLKIKSPEIRALFKEIKEMMK
jgi:hypothetical protein